MKVILQAIKSILHKIDHKMDDSIEEINSKVNAEIKATLKNTTKIVDVCELPSVGANANTIYRLTNKAYYLRATHRSVTTPEDYVIHCVEILPETANEFYDGDTRDIYYHVTLRKAYRFLDGAWEVYNGISIVQRVNDEVIATSGEYIVLNSTLHVYNVGWNEISVQDISGSGRNSVVSNDSMNVASGNYSFASGGGAFESDNTITITVTENPLVYSYYDRDHFTPVQGASIRNIGYGDLYFARIVSVDTDNKTVTLDRHIPNSNANLTYAVKYGIALGDYSHVEGYNNAATDYASHAEGRYTISSGNASHAEGCQTTASGNYSHAEGCLTTATSFASHAEGDQTTSSGNYSHAEGCQTTASGTHSHAEGVGVEASGTASHAEGSGVEASGKYSHAEGYVTIAAGRSQHTQGEYNIVDPEYDVNDNAKRGKYAHIVGNGTQSKRSNAHTLDWSGNAWFQGDVYVGGTSQDNGERLARLSDIPSGGGGDSNSPAIIDVVELPTENIQEDKFYRLLSGKCVVNRDVQIGFHVYCFETLPESGIPVTDAEQTETHSYYNASDGEVYGYIDDMLSMGTGVPVGWYPAATLFGAFNLPYSGIITDIEDDPCDDSFRFLISKDFYVYDGEWVKTIFAYERSPKFEITWDGVIGDKFALDMSSLGYEGIQFVKVSDDVFTEADIMGATYYQRSGYNWVIDYVDSSAYPGALNIDSRIIVVYSADDTNAALGLPAGYITNGTYFVYRTVDEVANYTYRFVGPNKISKIPSKYVNLDDGDGLSLVAITGDYNDLNNRPDLYNRNEVDNKFVEFESGLNLSSYATIKLADTKLTSVRVRDAFPSNAIISSIAYGDGKFVAVLQTSSELGYSECGRPIYSTDGIVWRRGDEINAGHVSLHSVFYASHRFVAIGSVGSSTKRPILVYSTDGIKWELIYLYNHGITYPFNITYGDGKFVIACDNRVYYSSDLDNWSEVLYQLDVVPFISYGNGKFVVLVDANSSISILPGHYSVLTSTDLTDWVSHDCDLYLDREYENVKFNYINDRFVAYATHHSGKTELLHSIDGINWQQGSLPTPPFNSRGLSIVDIVYGEERFIATTTDGGGKIYISRSYDFSTWDTKMVTNNGAIGRSYILICYGNGKFLISSLRSILYSDDGVEWYDYRDKIISLNQSDSDVTKEIVELITSNFTESDIDRIVEAVLARIQNG